MHTNNEKRGMQMVHRTIMAALLLLAFAPTSTASADSVDATVEITAPPVLAAETTTVPQSRGTVIGIHGGSWLLTGSEKLMAGPRPALARWRAAGWSTVNIDYRPGRAALSDIRAAVRDARRKTRRVCLYGESAGGHMALLVATQIKVDCVQTVGAPTDLPKLPAGDTRHAAEVTFGSRLATFSPARKRSTTITLVAHATHDRVVPYSQSQLPRWLNAERLSLDPGAHRSVHGGISSQSLRALRAAEGALRARLYESETRR